MLRSSSGVSTRRGERPREASVGAPRSWGRRGWSETNASARAGNLPSARRLVSRSRRRHGTRPRGLRSRGLSAECARRLVLTVVPPAIGLVGEVALLARVCPAEGARRSSSSRPAIGLAGRVPACAGLSRRRCAVAHRRGRAARKHPRRRAGRRGVCRREAVGLPVLPRQEGPRRSTWSLPLLPAARSPAAPFLVPARAGAKIHRQAWRQLGGRAAPASRPSRTPQKAEPSPDLSSGLADGGSCQPPCGNRLRRPGWARSPGVAPAITGSGRCSSSSLAPLRNRLAMVIPSAQRCRCPRVRGRPGGTAAISIIS